MDKTEKQPSIAVADSGYVGLVAATCFAEVRYQVICVDQDERKIYPSYPSHPAQEVASGGTVS